MASPDVAYASCGAVLCSALMDVLEGGVGCHRRVRQRGYGQGEGLVFEVLCLLLASSEGAKEAAVAGVFVNIHFISHELVIRCCFVNMHFISNEYGN